MKTVFLRALEADDKAEALLAAIRDPAAAHGKQRFEVETRSFAAVPRSPFAYWMGERLCQLFTDFPALETNGRAARQGGVNGDDFRWLRLWIETPLKGDRGRFVPIAKGGKFSPFYADLLLQAWWDPARDTFWSFTGLPHRPSLKPASFDFYFRPGLTWPRRTQGGLSLRPMPAGCIFADKGPAAFVANDDSDDLLALLALVNARPFRALVDLQMAFGSYEVGVIQRTPIPDVTPNDVSTLAALARRAWSLKRRLDTRIELSHAFSLPAALQVGGETFGVRAAAWSELVIAIEAELAMIQVEIDARCFDLYLINEADRRVVMEGFGEGATEPSALDEVEPDTEVDDDGDGENNADAMSLAAEMVSWALGVAVGRFDVRFATGARAEAPEPQPFDRLPICSPAMLVGDDDLPLQEAPADYPIAFPQSGVLVDDPGFARDIVAACRAVFDQIFGDSADSWWNEAAALLSPKDQSLRAWLATNLFEHHLKHCSKSRRKAPILWQLGTPSGRYSIWLYAHRLTRDSIFQLQNDVVAPKLAHEERQLTSMVQSTGGNPSAKERKEIAEQEAFVEELRGQLDEVKRLAPLWNPTLHDGVVLTMAPLWRLIPQHRAWQKELKSKWDELSTGKYDWAHIAMHLWPERVVPKCSADRSLAIAHGLEDIFWIQDEDAKWIARPNPKRSIDELIRERNSVAVKAALKGLNEATAPSGAGTRTRRSPS
ncbi:hypothetical protein ACU8L5_25340 (plasmid) [Rhizobium leguminosarum]